MTRRRARGLTLVELMLALGLTGIIGAAAAAMLVSVSYGTSSRTDIRRVLVKHKTLATRLAASARGSRQVLDAGDGWLMLWTIDADGDEQPNVSELQYVEFNAETGELRSHRAEFPGGWTQDQIDAADTAYDTGADWTSVAESLIEQTYFPGALWATGISDLTITLDSGQTTAARLVSFRVTVDAGDLSETAVTSAALRNR
jgi:type II secretory pathway pseudopilin PulG